ncbi:MAG: hypothetical protein RLZZ25_1054 [Gemmatimonadota bacterium]
MPGRFPRMSTLPASVHQTIAPALAVSGGHLTVTAPDALAGPLMDALVRQAVFGSDEERAWARWVIWEAARAVGTYPASIHGFYMARGRGDVPPVTVPAMNIRGASYDTMRSIFRTANAMDGGAFILEIARSEIAYTEQRPDEYVSVALAAALREGFRGPVFIQGDHFQVNAKKYKADPTTELDAVKQLVREGIAAGFYNIDLDTSTLVDLAHPTLDAQQRLNYELGVELTRFARALEPAGITVSLGGEIGEVGTENSTVPELEAFMDGYNRTLAAQAPGMVGLSKISVQSGTSHGGVVLPDGSIAEVALDFQTLEDLSRVARQRYGLSGAVQHGASTLPDGAFHHFPRTETSEIHLATGFQNMLYDHLPAALREAIYAWLRVHAAEERKAGDSDEQFFYKTRKKALGPFKRQLWDLPAEVRQTLAAAYDAKFTFLFEQLAVRGTKAGVRRFVTDTPVVRQAPGMAVVVEAAPDDADAGE